MTELMCSSVAAEPYTNEQAVSVTSPACMGLLPPTLNRRSCVQAYITMDCLAVASSCHDFADWDDLQTLKWAQTVDPHQSEECELLLETYSMQVGCHCCITIIFLCYVSNLLLQKVYLLSDQP